MVPPGAHLLHQGVSISCSDGLLTQFSLEEKKKKEEEKEEDEEVVAWRRGDKMFHLMSDGQSDDFIIHSAGKGKTENCEIPNLVTDGVVLDSV